MRDPGKDTWNKQQKVLRGLFSRPHNYREALELCLKQHAMVHSAHMRTSQENENLISFEDELLKDLTEETLREVPVKSDYSIAWHLWHSARIEDITINLLIAHEEQLLNCDDWYKRIGIRARDTGNAMEREEVRALSSSVCLEGLFEYRLAVGRKTAAVISALSLEQLKQKVKAEDLEQVKTEGAVVPGAEWLLDYWGKRTVAGLLLMPATRHLFVHLNEASRLKS